LRGRERLCGKFLRSLEFQPCFHQSRLCYLQFGLLRFERGLRSQGLGLELICVQRSQYLVELDSVVVAHFDRLDGTGQLAAHVHLIDRLQCTRCSHRDAQTATLYLNRLELRRACIKDLIPHHEPYTYNQNTNDRDDAPSLYSFSVALDVIEAQGLSNVGVLMVTGLLNRLRFN
jgi:hypothetical protein